jgi:hypothetical protein
MSRVLFPHLYLSAVFECPSLSRCPTRTRRRIGDDLEFPRCRAMGRTGGTGSSPWGSITRLSATTAHFELSDGSLFSLISLTDDNISHVFTSTIMPTMCCVLLVLALSVGLQILNSYWEYCSIDSVHMCAYLYLILASIQVVTDRRHVHESPQQENQWVFTAVKTSFSVNNDPL